MRGVVVWKKDSVSDSERVDLSSLPLGNYVLSLISVSNVKVNQVKITKLGK
jgi:hypothetical protein